ncbi:MAG: adenylosuccinate lyase family protein [Pseudomonadota bacterium]|nr:adenylosuccinate lyase family protein [Pseudomonadota bacterium]
MAVNPADSVVFGTLYGSDAMRAVFDEAALFRHMLAVEAALARVQGRLGIIPEAAAAQIGGAAAIVALDPAELAASVRRVGYPVVGLVAALSRAAGDAGRWTHWGATTQDIMDTALALQLRDGFALIRADLVATIHGLADLAERHRDTIMAGRTHLQHALPTVFGLKCATWLQPMLGDLARLDAAQARAVRVEFGGAAGTLASLGDQGLAVAEGLAAELGLAMPLAPWHACRDGLAEAACALAILCGSLAKMATDVILLSQTEVAEVTEPYLAGRGSSSTMPQKRNPIASEYILAAARVVQALAPVMLGAMAADHERATGPWQAEPLALPQSFVLAHGALLHGRALAEGLVVNTGRMRRNLDLSGGLIMAEAVMMGLAPALGREAAHHAVKHACDAALSAGSTLFEALMAEPGIAALGADTIRGLLDPAGYLGSAGVFVDRVVAAARETVSGPA